MFRAYGASPLVDPSAATLEVQTSWGSPTYEVTKGRRTGESNRAKTGVTRFAVQLPEPENGTVVLLRGYVDRLHFSCFVLPAFYLISKVYTYTQCSG